MFFLARTLGMTVGELGRRMSSSELVEWEASYDLEPWGDARRDLMDAVLTSLVARIGGSKKAQASDFLPKFDTGRRPPPTPRELKRRMRSILARSTAAARR